MPKGNRGTSRFEILVNPNKSLNEGVSYLPISGFLVLWQKIQPFYFIPQTLMTALKTSQMKKLAHTLGYYFSSSHRAA